MFQLTRDEQLSIATGLIILSVVVAGVFMKSPEGHSPSYVAEMPQANNQDSKTSNRDEDGSKMIYVHVAGEVYRSGVYKVSLGTRVGEVILKAGPKPGYDSDSLNLAAIVHDGDKIFVRSKDGSGTNTAFNPALRNTSEAGRMININTATREQLESLPYIGEVMAGRILEYRNTKQFNRVEDIMNVRGIGEKTFDRIKDLICVH